MLSYQHIYHAGCFADVVKHLVLTTLLDYLTQKEKPLFYMETHSGRGLYDLESAYSKKTAESEAGIKRLWEKRDTLPQVAKTYINIINELNPNGVCRYYPGSPYYAQQQLRPQDRLVLCELHPQEFSALELQFEKDRRILCLQQDGMQSLKAMLPPKEKRGLIFIDPAFELKNEYRTIPESVQSAFKRFSTGTYCLWYPIMDNKQQQQWSRRLKEIDATHMSVEFKQKHHAIGMMACGLWIINPTYHLAQELNALTPVWDSLCLNMDIQTWNNAT